MLVDCYRRRLFCKCRYEHHGLQKRRDDERTGFRRDCDRVRRAVLSYICFARRVAVKLQMIRPRFAKPSRAASERLVFQFPDSAEGGVYLKASVSVGFGPPLTG